MTVSRHSGYMDCDFPHQEAFDSTIISSSDHGQTWSPAPAFGASMFPDRRSRRRSSSTSGATTGRDRRVRVRGLDRRCLEQRQLDAPRARAPRPHRPPRRERLGVHPGRRPPGRRRADLGPASRDGAIDLPGRRPHEHDGDPLHRAARDLRAAAVALPRDRHAGPGWGVTRWELYQAANPWGPWELFHTVDWAPSALYNPWIVSRFTSDDGMKPLDLRGRRLAHVRETRRRAALHAARRAARARGRPCGVLPTGKSEGAKAEREIMRTLFDGAASQT